jgi:transposase InsO family protein
MEAKGKRKKRKGAPSGGGSRRKRNGGYSYEIRLKAVNLHLKKGFSLELVAEETGVSLETLRRWVKRYREKGEAGLRSPYRKGTSRTPKAVKDKITKIKEKNPTYGKKRISNLLRRMFFLKASPDTVQKTLKEKGMVKKTKKRKKRKKNPAKPRFFERARPNQMWQSDILTFRLGGKNAYLIGFMDDYSRYITGMELYRSQTAEHLLEVYRRAIAEYNVPREVLTDNGRQYTNWRGTTRFEKELKKDNIRHIRSAPHHPMTLGKIERFWKTIFGEFLSRAQFESFDDARERVRFWLKYYNHLRPHQGIEGMCPADRFFEIQNDLKKLIQEGIEENVLEMALRGRPRDPFYMVGRMGQQSVVIRAEKGKVKMSVEGEDEKTKELEYSIEKEKKDGDERESQEQVTIEADVQRDGKSAGGAGGMDGAAPAHGDMPGAGRELDDAQLLAEGGAGEYAERAGAEEQGGREEAGSGGAAEEAAGQEDPAAGEGPHEAPAAPGEDTPGEGERLRAEVIPGWERALIDEEFARQQEGGDDPEGEVRGDDSLGGRQATRDIPEDVLPVGEEGARRDDGGAGGEAPRPEERPEGCGEGGAEEEAGGEKEGEYASSRKARDPKDSRLGCVGIGERRSWNEA